MNKFVFLLLVSFSGVLFAQNQDSSSVQTLMKSTNSNGGYGSLVLRYGTLNHRDAMFLGGRVAWLINHWIGLGLSGHGFVNEPSKNTILDPTGAIDYNINGGYCGLLIQPLLAPRFPFHLSFPLTLGVGGIAYNRNIYDRWNDQYNFEVDSDVFLIAEQGIELEINLIKYVRFSAGVHYRYTSHVQLVDESGKVPVKSDVFNGMSYGIGLTFGAF